MKLLFGPGAVDLRAPDRAARSVVRPVDEVAVRVRRRDQQRQGREHGRGEEREHAPASAAGGNAPCDASDRRARGVARTRLDPTPRPPGYNSGFLLRASPRASAKPARRRRAQRRRRARRRRSRGDPRGRRRCRARRRRRARRPGEASAARRCRHSEDHAARALAEEARLARAPAQLDQRIEVGLEPDSARDRHLGERAGEPAVADVVGGGRPAPSRTTSRTKASASAHRLDLDLRQPGVELASLLGELRARQRGRERPDQDQPVALQRARCRARAPDRAARRPCRRPASGRSGRARSRCRARRCPPTTGTRRPRQASASPEHRAVELPGDAGLLRVAEVEAVGQPERLGAGAGEVLRALEHRLDRPGVGVAGDPPPVAVDRDGDRPAGLGQHRAPRRRRPRAAARCASRRSSRTARTPSASGDVRGGEQAQSIAEGSLGSPSARRSGRRAPERPSLPYIQPSGSSGSRS